MIDETKIKKGWQEVSRETNKKFIKDKKANFRVGGYVGYFDSVASNCEICGVEIYFLDKKEEMKDMLKKNVKDICAKCALEKDGKEMPPKQKNILEEIVKKHDRERHRG